MSNGWKREPARHSLAARGIRTGQRRERRINTLYKPTKHGSTMYSLRYEYENGEVNINGIFNPDTRVMWVEKITARPEGIGLGGQALADFEEYSRKLGAKRIRGFPLPDAMEFLLRHDFKESPVVVDTETGAKYPVMEKVL